MRETSVKWTVNKVNYIKIKKKSLFSVVLFQQGQTEALSNVLVLKMSSGDGRGMATLKTGSVALWCHILVPSISFVPRIDHSLFGSVQFSHKNEYTQDLPQVSSKKGAGRLRNRRHNRRHVTQIEEPQCRRTVTDTELSLFVMWYLSPVSRSTPAWNRPFWRPDGGVVAA